MAERRPMDPIIAAVLDLESRGPRIFARLEAGQLTCPRCGEFSEFGKRYRRHGRHDAPAWRRTLYDPATMLWTCPGCGLRAYLGITAYATHAREGVPSSDSVPTPGEATVLRSRLHTAEPLPRGGRHRRINRLCTCLTGCLVHGPATDSQPEGDD